MAIFDSSLQSSDHCNLAKNITPGRNGDDTLNVVQSLISYIYISYLPSI